MKKYTLLLMLALFATTLKAADESSNSAKPLTEVELKKREYEFKKRAFIRNLKNEPANFAKYLKKGKLPFFKFQYYVNLFDMWSKHKATVTVSKTQRKWFVLMSGLLKEYQAVHPGYDYSSSKEKIPTAEQKAKLIELQKKMIQLFKLRRTRFAYKPKQ
jgi:hypothetical protein